MSSQLLCGLLFRHLFPRFLAVEMAAPRGHIPTAMLQDKPCRLPRRQHSLSVMSFGSTILYILRAPAINWHIQPSTLTAPSQLLLKSRTPDLVNTNRTTSPSLKRTSSTAMDSSEYIKEDDISTSDLHTQQLSPHCPPDDKPPEPQIELFVSWHTSISKTAKMPERGKSGIIMPSRSACEDDKGTP